MSQTAARMRVSYAEYLAAEAASMSKHAWLDDEGFARAGGTPEHAALAAAVGAELSVALRGRPCRVFGADALIRVLATGLDTYPDVSVVCGRLETDPDDADAITNPVLLVEVLSDSTEAYDRGEKFAHYRRIPSLREYVLVSQQSRRIEVYQRNEAGRWELHDAGAGGTLELTSIGCSIAVNDVYRDPLAQPGEVSTSAPHQ